MDINELMIVGLVALLSSGLLGCIFYIIDNIE